MGSMSAQQVSGPKFTGLKQPPHYSEIDDQRKTSRLSKKRSTDGWHGWFPALQDEKPYRKAIALDSEPFPSVSASYFDLVRDPKTGEITFWTKEAGGQNPLGLGGIDGRQQDHHKRAVQRLRVAI